MKLLKKIGIFSILSVLSTATFAKDFSFECLDKEEINYNLDFLEGKSVLLDTKSFEKDFKEGIECYSPATFSKMTYLKSNYIIEDKNFFYENVINLGEQAYFLNGKIRSYRWKKSSLERGSSFRCPCPSQVSCLYSIIHSRDQWRFLPLLLRQLVAAVFFLLVLD